MQYLKSPSTHVLVSSVMCVLYLGNTDGSIRSHYCGVSRSHTSCLYQPGSFGRRCVNAEVVPTTNKMKSLIVDRHNYYRSRVANGQERAGRPGPQPSAANMQEMVWDDELARIAETWARQCTFEHDTNRNVRRFGVGQNLFQMSSSSRQGMNADWARAIDSFYKEVKDMNKYTVSSFRSNGGPVIGHYTQMVAGRTRTIGCAAVSYFTGGRLPYSMLYVCNYGPAGNIIGQPVYIQGKPCSLCPFGTKYCRSGLCV